MFNFIFNQNGSETNFPFNFHESKWRHAGTRIKCVPFHTRNIYNLMRLKRKQFIFVLKRKKEIDGLSKREKLE